jgi:hypothetical protein
MDGEPTTATKAIGKFIFVRFGATAWLSQIEGSHKVFLFLGKYGTYSFCTSFFINFFYQCSFTFFLKGSVASIFR